MEYCLVFKRALDVQGEVLFFAVQAGCWRVDRSDIGADDTIPCGSTRRE